MKPAIKQPMLAPKMKTSALSQATLQSDEPYHGTRYVGGKCTDRSIEHLDLQQIEFRRVTLDNSELFAARMTDIRLNECSLSNLICERLLVHRAEFFGCRLVGLNITDGHLQNVIFQNCDMQLARFRFSSFKSVLFEECKLQDANFQGADLSGVRFRKCDLSRTEMSQAKLSGTDFRTSVIEGMRVGPMEVVGAVVDHFQAAYMASLLGLVIKNEDAD